MWFKLNENLPEPDQQVIVKTEDGGYGVADYYPITFNKNYADNFRPINITCTSNCCGELNVAFDSPVIAWRPINFD